MPVTIADLIREMESLLDTAVKGSDQAVAYELEQSLATLRIKQRANVLDPLTDLDTLTALDLKKLNASVSAAKTEINDIKARNEAIAVGMMLIRGAIKAAGLGI